MIGLLLGAGLISGALLLAKVVHDLPPVTSALDVLLAPADPALGDDICGDRNPYLSTHICVNEPHDDDHHYYRNQDVYLDELRGADQ